MTLTRHLDYESTHRHSLVITATDMGIPSLSANLTVSVEVQDVNDNPPIFERAEYTVKVLETLPINSQVSTSWHSVYKLYSKSLSLIWTNYI